MYQKIFYSNFKRLNVIVLKVDFKKIILKYIGFISNENV